MRSLEQGIEPATFRFVVQHLNHCATAVPTYVGRNKKRVFKIALPKRVHVIRDRIKSRE